MNSGELRQKFLTFFEKRGHARIPSASLIPENDPSVLFTTAGMQQFKPYYTGQSDAEKDFGSLNVTSVQKCVRTSDIDEVGDESHLTFFEMLGNFSFGGYWKKEAIQYAYDFLVKELVLNISYVTYYRGSDSVPKDIETKNIWMSIDPGLDIREDGSDVFWGPTGDSGPCGPTTEIYCKNSEGKDVEIWNIVFNEYFCDGSREKLDKGEAKLTTLEKSGIDTGMGFERLLTVLNNKKSVYDTDLFFGEETREERIVSDHVKTALFMISDGVRPSNSGQGYVLRRLIRRAVKFSKGPLKSRVEKIKNAYSGIYVLDDKGEIEKEEEKFRKTLEQGLKEFEKGRDPFVLATTYGFPIELTLELAHEKGISVDLESFNKKIAEHQKLSQTSSSGMFKGGLADHSENTVKLHTAHHLLLAALQKHIDKNIKQKGSNITSERLRMDFSFDRKLTDDEKKTVENQVNEWISGNFDVIKREMKKEEAEKLGAQMEFGAKYPDVVSVYIIQDKDGNTISKEFCGGPHISNTRELGTFKIVKEEAVSQGVRRIKAILE